MPCQSDGVQQAPNTDACSAKAGLRTFQRRHVMRRFRVLDECDEMLNMGFVEDVEKILTAGGDIKTQTLLFSATLPVWVKDITRRFLEPTHKLVDLVGTDKMKVSGTLCYQGTVHGSHLLSAARRDRGRCIILARSFEVVWTSVRHSLHDALFVQQ